MLVTLSDLIRSRDNHDDFIQKHNNIDNAINFFFQDYICLIARLNGYLSEASKTL